jgi:hypothetical protein
VGHPFLRTTLCYKRFEDPFFNIAIRNDGYTREALFVLFKGLEDFKAAGNVVPIQSIIIRFKLDIGYETIFLLEIRIPEAEINEIFELLERVDFVFQHGLKSKAQELSIQSVQAGNQIENIISVLANNFIQ